MVVRRIAWIGNFWYSVVMRIAVIGAGISGLATTYELSKDASVSVRCFSPSPPMSFRSAGVTRHFRVTHWDGELVSYALEAYDGWQRWSGEAGERLLGNETVLVSDPLAEARAQVALDAGASVMLIDRHPGLRAITSLDDLGPTVLDPMGGVIRAARAGAFLFDHVGAMISCAEVISIEEHRDTAVVRTEQEEWSCDSVVIAAGAGTPRLAKQIGIEVDVVPHHIFRHAFPIRDRGGRPPTWFDHRRMWNPDILIHGNLEHAGYWAVELTLPWFETQIDPEVDSVDEVAARVSDVTHAYVREVLDGLGPTGCEVIRSDILGNCSDGFAAARSGRSLVVWGDNFFKFAPILGRDLARAATDMTVPVFPVTG